MKLNKNYQTETWTWALPYQPFCLQQLSSWSIRYQLKFFFTLQTFLTAAPGGVLKNTGSINMSLMVCYTFISFEIKLFASSWPIHLILADCFKRFGFSRDCFQWWVPTAMLNWDFWLERWQLWNRHLIPWELYHDNFHHDITYSLTITPWQFTHSQLRPRP